MSRQNMSNIKHTSFGETLRKLREEAGMPLRILASRLDIDQSTLSKIERNERKASEDLIEKISAVFKIGEKELRVNLMSDIIAYKLRNEEDSIDVLKVAEEKLVYLKTKKKRKK